MVDGVLLLVDASEGPLPQTRFVLRKTLEAHLPVILVINKVDRPDARIAEVIDEVYELFLDLDASDHHIEFPIVYTNARAGWASLEAGVEGSDLKPLCELILEHIPAPVYEDGPPVPGDGHEPRRVAVRRAPRDLSSAQRNGDDGPAGCVVPYRRNDREGEDHRAVHDRGARPRSTPNEAGPGDIIAIAGFADITIGETLADADDPRPLPPLIVDEPSLSMTVGINTSPLAGQDGQKLTARQVENRLQQELVGNVSLRVLPTDASRFVGSARPRRAPARGARRDDAPRRFRAHRRQAAGRRRARSTARCTSRSKLLTIDVPEDYLGVVIAALALRKGRMEQMINHGTGWVRMDFRVPARGLIGFRTEFMTETRGTGMLHHVFDGYAPWFGELRTRPTGVSSPTGVA